MREEEEQEWAVLRTVEFGGGEEGERKRRES